MADYSPTGYWAHISIRPWKDGEPQAVTIEEIRPILHWNLGGQPVISDESGKLVTPEQYIEPYTKDADPEEPGITYRGSFEVHP